jgi:hypothetical protein
VRLHAESLLTTKPENRHKARRGSNKQGRTEEAGEIDLRGISATFVTQLTTTHGNQALLPCPFFHRGNMKILY